jgi:NTP pyrophosphatase (non-canonical NTP hydrolase)
MPVLRFGSHRDSQCKLVHGHGTINHEELRRLYDRNEKKRPVTLEQWQQMFQEIYPREADDRARSTIGLFEELGEIAEAIRVFEKHPMYFLGEAADVFSYLMGIANEHALRLKQEYDQDLSLADEFLRRYPGLCMQCGSRICICPAIPEATVGRMAKELKITVDESPFLDDPEGFATEGQGIARQVLEVVGGYKGLSVSGLPFDRGDANHALVTLLLKVADAVEGERLQFAERLRAEALKLGTTQAQPGSANRSLGIGPLLQELSEIWRGLDSPVKATIKAADELVGGLGTILDKIRVLFVPCSPSDAARLRVDSEHRTIIEAINLGPNRNVIEMTMLPAATIEDLRRALLGSEFEIIQFSGHGDAEHLVFETADGKASPVPLSAIAELLEKYPSVQCVILNACETAKTLIAPISPITVAMDKSISDMAAIEFARGFYDALAAGRCIEFAIREGITAVKLKSLDATPIKLMKSEPSDSTRV